MLTALQVVGAVREQLVAVVGHEQQILDAHAAEAVAVEAGLDRDHIAGDELLAEHPERGRLVHLEADSVAEPW